jgi:hypothetical protein
MPRDLFIRIANVVETRYPYFVQNYFYFETIDAFQYPSQLCYSFHFKMHSEH